LASKYETGNKMKNKKRVSFTPHAKEKLRRLLQSGVTKKEAIKTIENPESLTSGYFGRKVAQSKLTRQLPPLERGGL
jgi:hypothetical protein